MFKNPLPKNLKEIDILLQDTSKISEVIEKISHFPNLEFSRPVCGKILKASDTAFKCFDCEKDPTCIICSECKENSNHEGHRVIPQFGASGCCDCGDLEAWDQNGCCSKHNGKICKVEAFKNLLPENHTYLKETIEALVFYFVKHLTTQNSVLKVPIEYLRTICDVFQISIEKGTPYALVCTDVLQAKIPERFEIEMKEFSKFHNEAPPNPLDFILFYVDVIPNQIQKALVDIFINFFMDSSFKSSLTISFLRNYKCISNFQKSKFMSLSVQLFTSDDAVIEALKKSSLAEIFSVLMDDKIYENKEYVVFEVFFAIKYITSKPILAKEFLRFNNGKEIEHYLHYLSYFSRAFILQKRKSHILYDKDNFPRILSVAIEEEINDSILRIAVELRNISIEEKFSLLKRLIVIFEKDIDLISKLKKTLSIILPRFFYFLLLSINQESPDELYNLLKDSHFIDCLMKCFINKLIFLRELELGKWVYYGDLPSILIKGYYESKIISKFHIDVSAFQFLMKFSQKEFFFSICKEKAESFEWLFQVFLHISATEHSQNLIKHKLKLVSPEIERNQNIESLKIFLSAFGKIKTLEFKGLVNSRYFPEIKSLTSLFNEAGEFDSKSKIITSKTKCYEPIFFLSDPNIYAKASENKEYEVLFYKFLHKETFIKLLDTLLKEMKFPQNVSKFLISLKKSEFHEDIKPALDNFLLTNIEKFSQDQKSEISSLFSTKPTKNIFEEEVKIDSESKRKCPSQQDIINKFRLQQANFLKKNVSHDMDVESEDCSICREKKEDSYVIPIYFEKSSLINGIEAALRFSTCSHQFHSKCLLSHIQEKKETIYYGNFLCPKCNKLSKCYLGNSIEGLVEHFKSEKLVRSEIKNGIEYFSTLCSLFPKEMAECKIKADLELYKKLFSLIENETFHQEKSFLEDLRRLFLFKFFENEIPLETVIIYFESDFDDINIELQYLQKQLNIQENVTLKNPPPSIINLPLTYRKLNSIMISTRCSFCNEVSSKMACLICFQTFCSPKCKKAEWNHQKGNCNHHAVDSHGGSAIFIDFKNAFPLIIANSQNYLDQSASFYQDQYEQNISVKETNWELYQLNTNLVCRLRNILLNGTCGNEIRRLIGMTNMEYFGNYF